MLSRKDAIICLLVVQVEKIHSMNEWIFTKTKFLGTSMNVKLDSSNCPTQTDLENATLADTTDFPKKTGLDNLKSCVDKLDIKKIKNVLQI